MLVTKTASLYWVTLCAIISGVLLIWAVFKIRRFFKVHSATDFIDVPMLLRHAFAFGLYLLSTTAYAIMVMLGNLYPESLTIYNIKGYVGIGDVIVQCIA